MQQEFSPAAALQASVDVRLGVATILRQFARQNPQTAAAARPARLIEAVELLTLPAATALLLHDSVGNFDSLEEAKDALAERALHIHTDHSCFQHVTSSFILSMHNMSCPFVCISQHFCAWSKHRFL